MKYFRIISIITTTFLGAGNCIAQDTAQFNKVTVKFYPHYLLDGLNFRSLVFGLEYRPIPQFSIEASYGQALSVFSDKVSGYKAKVELRKYFAPLRSQGEIKFYGGLEGYLYYLKYPVTGWFINDTSQNMSDSYEDHVTVIKDIKGVNAKVGITWNLCTRLIINAFAGVGVRIKNFHVYDKLNPEDEIGWDHQNNPSFPANRNPIHEGYSAMPNLTMGGSIGYILCKGRK